MKGPFSRASLRLRRSRKFPNNLCFPLAVGSAIGMEYFMKPDGRRVHDVRLLPGIPRQISLRFAGDQSPIDRGHVVLLRNRQDRVECAPDRSGHELGAADRAMVVLLLAL